MFISALLKKKKKKKKCGFKCFEKQSSYFTVCELRIRLEALMTSTCEETWNFPILTRHFNVSVSFVPQLSTHYTEKFLKLADN